MSTIPRKKSRCNRAARRTNASVKIDHDPKSTVEVVERDVNSITPSPENEKLYRPVTPSDPEVRKLAKSISKYGVKEPLRVTLDSVLISGHRRLCAAKMAGLTTVPVIVEQIYSDDPQFLVLLREANRQRVKSLAEVTRELAIDANPQDAYQAVLEHRWQKSEITKSENIITIRDFKNRSRITAAKQPFLEAINEIIEARREFWPLSVRSIHYVLLNKPPLIHASKPHSRYTNSRAAYKAAIDLITRARLEGLVPWDSIDDETRPITTWDLHQSIGSFISSELDDFLTRYWRDLLQSQPNQIEIVGEKNTIASIIHPVASQFCCTYTIGRGYASLPPRYKMAQRFKESGKEKLIIMVLSDHDPEGDDIPHSFARSMRDDFGIENVTGIKVALTAAHVARFGLQPNNLDNKSKGSRYKQFVKRYGNEGYELEAMQPSDLQQLLRDALDRVIDVDQFNAEIEKQNLEQAHLAGMRRAVKEQLKDVKFEDYMD